MQKVIDVLTSKDSNIWSVDPLDTAYSALEIMAEKDIGAVLVIEKGKLVGIFTERDYARKVILKGKASRETKVEELMISPVFSIGPEKSINECMALMTASDSRYMPVVEDDKLIGLISMGDVVNAIITALSIEIRDLKNYTFTDIFFSEWTDS